MGRFILSGFCIYLAFKLTLPWDAFHSALFLKSIVEGICSFKLKIHSQIIFEMLLNGILRKWKMINLTKF